MFSKADLDAFRSDAESLHTDRFAAFGPPDPDDPPVYDADGYKVEGLVPKGTTPGKAEARSRQGDTTTRFVRVGGVDLPVIEGGLEIPISAPVPTAGDRGIGWEYECTAIGAYSDPAILGRRFLVVHAPAASHTITRQLDVVEV